MTELANMTPELDAQLAEVLEDYLQALEAGTAPARALLLARHPELAEQLEACIGSLDFIRQAAARDVRHIAALPGGRGQMDKLVDLGDYRIVREIGRGGMGIVYEAEQRPAQAAALLQHPHVVPVLGVGCERDVHYYVMKYIDGCSLAAAIEEPAADAFLDRAHDGPP